MKYEYIRLAVDVGDLSELNSLSSVGFRVVAVIDEKDSAYVDSDGCIYRGLVHYALLERELPE